MASRAHRILMLALENNASNALDVPASPAPLSSENEDISELELSDSGSEWKPDSEAIDSECENSEGQKSHVPGASNEQLPIRVGDVVPASVIVPQPNRVPSVPQPIVSVVPQSAPLVVGVRTRVQPAVVGYRGVEDWVERSPRIRKRLSKEERLAKQRERHQLLGRCECKHVDCHAKDIDIATLRKVNKDFWSCSYLEQTAFLSRNVTRKDVKRCRTKGVSQRTCTMRYTLPIEIGKSSVVVCKQQFLKVLGTKSAKILNRGACRGLNGSFTSAADQRGHHTPKHAFTEEKKQLVKAHILSFKPCISHYRREHAPRRFYLPPELTAKGMFDDFASQYPQEQLHYSTYQQTVKSMNISFAKLGTEECSECEIFRNHEHDETGAECNTCDEWKIHNEQAAKARSKYISDMEKSKANEDGILYLSVDMQKILLLPTLHKHPKLAAFISRLVAFHESFVPLAGGKSGRKIVAALWHEGLFGRKGDEVASVFFEALRAYNANDIVLWSDNCCGQNKNWYLYTAFVFLVNSDDGPNNLTIKYLAKGHTAMSADSFHAAVERKISKTGDVFSFEALCDLVRCAGPKVEVLPVKTATRWSNKLIARKKTTTLHNLKAASFSRGSLKLTYKTDHEGEWETVDFLPKKIQAMVKNKEEFSTTGVRGIPAIKKKRILEKLGPLLDERSKRFYETLPENDDSVDLQVSDD